MKKTIAIVHYNTPELTTAGIKSIRKKSGMDWKVVVFDNSNERPFAITEPLGDVTIIDNTKGQIIDFDAELAKFPNKCSYLPHFASARHMMSVQKLWELVPQGFILMESDVILSQPIDFMWDENYAAVGKIQHFEGTGRLETDRLLPMLCYMNVPKLVANGAKYFDPVRNFGLHSDDEKDPLNWYDTGASIEVKRNLIKNSDKVFQRLGTKWAVEHIISTYFGEGYIEEWFEYEGEPGHFRVFSSNPSLNNERLTEFLNILNKVKRASTKLDGIFISLTGQMPMTAGVAYHESGHDTYVLGGSM